MVFYTRVNSCPAFVYIRPYVFQVKSIKGKLLDYQIRAVTGGKDALGEVGVKLETKGREVAGRGTSTDIIEASVKAYLQALNRVFAYEEKRHYERLV